MSARRLPRRTRPQILVIANPTESSDESDDARPPPSRPPAYPGPPLPRTPQPATAQAAATGDKSGVTRDVHMAPASPQLPRSFPVYDIHAHYPPTSGESSTSRSSPAPESTPPPTTPGTLQPPENAIPRAEPGLKHAYDDSRIPYFAAQPPPAHIRRPSDSQLAVPRSPIAVAGPSSPRLQHAHIHSPDRLVIMAALSENFVFVDITGARSSDFIRERIFSKLQIPDDEHHNFRVYRTEAGEFSSGPALDGDELLSICLQHGDKSGSLKFLVQPFGAYRQQLHVDTRDLAPPQIPQSQGEGGAGFSPLFQNRAAQQQHAKTRSISPGGDRNDSAAGDRDYNAASESDTDDRPRVGWRPHGKAPNPSSPRPSSARDGQSTASPSHGQASPHRLARATSPSPVSSNGTMLSVTPRQGSVTPTPPGGSDPNSWRPQPQQYGSFADASSPRRQMRGAFSPKSGQKVAPVIPPPPSRAPPPVPTNATPFTVRPGYKPLPAPGSATSPYSPRSQPYAASGLQSARPGTKAVDPRWFNVSVPGQSASPSTAQRFPLGPPPPPPPPPPTQSPVHRLPPARSVGDLRGAAHGLRRRPSTAKEESATPTSPYSPRLEGLPYAPNATDRRMAGFVSRTPDPSMGRPRAPYAAQRPDAYSDTEQTSTMIRRPALPISGQLSPTSRHAEQQFAQWQTDYVQRPASRDPSQGRAPQSPPLSPRGLQSPRSPGGDEATLMPKEYAHIIPLLSNPAGNAASVPLPPTPSPGSGAVLSDDLSRLHPTEPPNISTYDDDADTIWQSPPQPPAPRPVITVSVNGLEAPLSAQSANTPSPRSPTRTMVQPKRRPQSTFGAREGLTWNVRPPPEDVYEHLEEFFHEHDLDKPLIEMPSGASSPVGPESPAVAIPPPPAAPAPKQEASSSRAKHKKSIRIVANERRKIMDRTSKLAAEEAVPSDIARKRSTKLWDIKVEEVAPNVGKGGPPSAGPDSPTSARAITKWVKGDLIGKGTYGKVYLALNANTGEMIAVKQVELPKTDSDRNDTRQTSVVEAIKSESATLRELEHPHVVQYLGFEETSDFFNLFLEYVPGGSIGGVLRKLGKFSEEVSKSFTSQILSGLEYLHSRQVLHRDLKGDNILVERSGVCKISDFGISKRTTDIYGPDASATNMQGSIFWMAPEVLSNGGQGYSAKIDIWSVGCIYVEMITGHRPWRDEDFVSVMYKLGASKERPPIPELAPLASDFASLCFAPDPDDRPIAADLRNHQYLELPAEWKFTGFT